MCASVFSWAAKAFTRRVLGLCLFSLPFVLSGCGPAVYRVGEVHNFTEQATAVQQEAQLMAKELPKRAQRIIELNVASDASCAYAENIFLISDPNLKYVSHQVIEHERDSRTKGQKAQPVASGYLSKCLDGEDALNDPQYAGKFIKLSTQGLGTDSLPATVSAMAVVTAYIGALSDLAADPKVKIVDDIDSLYAKLMSAKGYVGSACQTLGGDGCKTAVKIAEDATSLIDAHTGILQSAGNLISVVEKLALTNKSDAEISQILRDPAKNDEVAKSLTDLKKAFNRYNDYVAKNFQQSVDILFQNTYNKEVRFDATFDERLIFLDHMHVAQDDAAAFVNTGIQLEKSMSDLISVHEKLVEIYSDRWVKTDAQRQAIAKENSAEARQVLGGIIGIISNLKTL